MHRHWMICGAVLAAAALVILTTGWTAGSAGLVVAALACPLAMVVAMKVLVGGQRSPTEAPGAPMDAEAR